MTQEIRADIPGNVWSIKVEPGQQVQTDDVLVVLESMKMEIPVAATARGTVARVLVEEGDAVDSGAALVHLD